MIAFCWRSGLIEFADSLENVPEGAIDFADNHNMMPELDDGTFKDLVQIQARQTRDKDTKFLVPGLPEAENDDAALAALERWVAWAFKPYNGEAA